jgi:hypothetical protein
MAKKPVHQFEDEIGALVDRYLLEQQVPIEEIRAVMINEATYDHAARLVKLLKKEKT